MFEKDNEENKVVDQTTIEALLGSIKNPNGEQKYKTIEDALNGLKHSQEFIPTLLKEKESTMDELKALKEKAEKVDALEQTLADFMAQQKEQTPTSEVSFESIQNLVRQTLTQESAEAEKKKNQASVVQALTQQFGDKAQEEFINKASQLGMSPEKLEELASTSPVAVKQLFGVSEQNAHKQTKNFAPFKTDVSASGFKAPTETNIKRFDKPLNQTSNVKEALERARAMAQELVENHGITADDLSNPKVFYKFMK